MAADSLLYFQVWRREKFIPGSISRGIESLDAGTFAECLRVAGDSFINQVFQRPRLCPCGLSVRVTISAIWSGSCLCGSDRNQILISQGNGRRKRKRNKEQTSNAFLSNMGFP
jgi:hypothetical protein